MPRTAKGIPDRSEFGDLSQLQAGQLYDYIVQKHQARRAGLHHDLRIGDPRLGLYSWALRKGIPVPGQKHLAVQQPLHSHSYGSFEGEIPKGYGAGTVSKHDEGQALITKVDPSAIHFTIAHRRYPERFALIKPKIGKNWLLINTTKTEPVPYEKVHYKTVPPEQAEEVLSKLQPGSSVQAKIDGAASLTKLYKEHPEVMSYRAAKGTGYPLVHTERVFGNRPAATYPKELAGSVLRGELYGAQDGKAIPPQQLGGLLNSTVANSLATQNDQGIKLKNLLFDIQQYGNKPLTHAMPYAQRLEKLREVAKHLPQDTFHLPDEAKTPEEAIAKWRQVVGGQEPLTHEGVVVHPATGKPFKIKQRAEHDVYVREMFPGMGKYENKGVGGFRYSWEPEGPIAGEVGTGLSDQLRYDMHQNPSEYLGRVAKVISQEKLPSGALRAPALLSMHEDLPMAPKVGAIDTPVSEANIEPEMGPKPVTIRPAPKGRTLRGLLEAKAESDRRNYAAKHSIMRLLIAKEPQNFFVDSEQDGIVGVTHKPTGFRIHMPRPIVPVDLLKPQISV